MLIVLVTLAIVLAVTVIGATAQAQTFQVIHNFQGPEGTYPAAGLIMDKDGNFYGTARDGGPLDNGYICTAFFLQGCGTVFKMTKQGTAWVVTPLFLFDGLDGGYPMAPVTIGPNGVLYGSTAFGGRCQSSPFGCGTIFSLTPGAISSTASPWSESVLYVFTGNADGGPLPSGVTFDAAGNMYGTSGYGGANNYGVVFEFTRSGNSWTQSLLYSFKGGNDGIGPGSLIVDPSGNHLLGITGGGGGGSACKNGCGTVFELTRTSSGWTETILHAFDNNDGALPSGVTIDKAGNLYGTTKGDYSCPATVWELSPSESGWIFNVLYTFSGEPTAGPYSGVTIDAAGNLYGTTYVDGPYSKGNVYKLTHSKKGWIYTDLHDFTGGSDGGEPLGNQILDGNGNLYGTTTSGGQWQILGVIWEITR